MTKTTIIIGGKFKGCKIKLVPSPQTKATSSLVKESLFNTLGNSVKNKIFLDLFAGNGSYGFEALSRDAKQVYFVDASLKAFQTLKENSQKLKINLQQNIIFYGHFIKALKKFQKANLIFDFIILDPPYFKDFYLPAFEYLNKLTHKNSIIICELHQKIVLPTQIKEFVLQKEKQYGNKKIQFYQKI
ncbi:16S rRNA (guanine(966)-N(2))-methyltransferase RsmD [Candidatus Phytoplasma asteris]|uniref:16S rRNA (Guanine(966)-N(2))-methyltransferase RsmD n=1 Tax=Candidatus Phytoplasma asteris TaxID=85620 RepID=A0ABZ2YI10_9MOLU